MLVASQLYEITARLAYWVVVIFTLLGLLILSRRGLRALGQETELTSLARIPRDLGEPEEVFELKSPHHR